MKIQGIEIHPNELDGWGDKLKDAFLNPQQAGQDQQAHKYLYINREGRFQSFFLNENIPQGHYKLYIDDMLKISQEILKSQNQHRQPLRTISQSYQVMLRGAQDTVWSAFVHWWKGLGLNTTKRLIQSDIRLSDDFRRIKKRRQFWDLKDEMVVLIAQIEVGVRIL